MCFTIKILQELIYFTQNAAYKTISNNNKNVEFDLNMNEYQILPLFPKI